MKRGPIEFVMSSTVTKRHKQQRMIELLMDARNVTRRKGGANLRYGINGREVWVFGGKQRKKYGSTKGMGVPCDDEGEEESPDFS